ncbi:ATP-binding protein [Salinisphaera hydrothermalis]|uniref:histidine kinase n=1 Tax=Salinisphaera hydrothermalis (strain C41B8) TaxID=1304275 RepID=A0A084IPQ6_SALHC|nr:ATP-binding protein [Salinisphaera hydrothermalis]KEZ78690.1 integral membrane sensor hybrid histidine kinase [Salinisphaera hydrothermalis C41B8]
MLDNDGKDEALKAWEAYDRSERIRFSKIGCILALILMPAGVSLDIFVYPGHAATFFCFRLVADAFLLVILALHFQQRGKFPAGALIFAWLSVAQIAICMMIYLTDGFASTYYAGLNLAILGMGILLPVSLIEVLIFSGMTLALYLAAGFAHSPGPINFGLLYNNVYFMLTTSVISATAVYFSRRRRLREFSLNFELSNRNQELSELDRIKSEFFANISHEFRTPLTLILAPLDGLLEERESLPEPAVRRLDLIRQNSLRLLRLVNDLLDVIRLEEGRADLDRRNLRFDTLLADVIQSMVPLAEARGITLTPDLDASPIVVMGDRSALEKVFLNLLSNAIKFTPKGGNIRASSIPTADSVAITIEDTGIGMRRESLPYVFDRFRQADSSSTRKYGGTGLGLALVKEITEAHGGQVTIDSEQGQGTTVRVTLPTLAIDTLNPETPVEIETDNDIAPQRQLDLAAQLAAVATTHEPETDLSEEDSTAFEHTVLVVDDEPDMRRYLADLLSKEYRVIVAIDGKQALEVARRERPALIVLDLMLPEIDGLEVCRRIKQDIDLRASRIVLLTARANEPSKLIALDNGADDFLTKPFSGIEVRTRLRNLLRNAKLERDLHRRNKDLEDALNRLSDAQDQLVHSEKLNALGRLSAGLLHEINNPLNYTLTALEFAKTDPAVEADSDLREILGDIDEGMQRIRGIVKELRAFAYPSKSEKTAFSLSGAVLAAIQMSIHEAQGIRVNNRVGDDWVVIGSRNHITQVTINLLSNAFKAIRSTDMHGTGEVTISATEKGDRVSVSVLDNGSGIAPEDIDRVFDPFYTTADVGEGMGMGLSVCQTIIRNHDGELTVDSENGKWTRFSFDLQLGALELETEESSLQSAAHYSQ